MCKRKRSHLSAKSALNKKSKNRNRLIIDKLSEKVRTVSTVDLVILGWQCHYDISDSGILPEIHRLRAVCNFCGPVWPTVRTHALACKEFLRDYLSLRLSETLLVTTKRFFNNTKGFLWNPIARFLRLLNLDKLILNQADTSSNYFSFFIFNTLDA